MNVLLTSSGRRAYLVDYFKQALQGGGLVFASNSEMSPALMRADDYGISPLIYSEDYIPWVLSFAKEHEVGLIVPLFDIDLPVLAKNRKRFEEAGIVLAVSPPETVETVSDKFAMFEKLTKAGIGSPNCVLSLEEAKEKLNCQTDDESASDADDVTKLSQAGMLYAGREPEKAGDMLRAAGRMHRRYGADTPDGLSRDEMEWPVILKPRYGMGSLGLFAAENAAELTVFYGKCLQKVQNSYLKYESAAAPAQAVLIQELKDGDEYGLDVICDFKGNYITTIVRYKMAMRSGETDEAVVLGPEDPEYAVLVKLGRKLASAFEIHGIMDVDVIMDPAQLFPYVIDMNARFGGGYPFSHVAGANLPAAYLAWAAGEPAEAAWLTPQPGVHAYKDIEIRKYEE